jgi:hypothetical protein
VSQTKSAEAVQAAKVEAGKARMHAALKGEVEEAEAGRIAKLVANAKALVRADF